MRTFEEIQEANKFVRTIEVKGKQYAEVNQRIKAFRFLYPEGTIETELISDDGAKCIFKATVKNGETILGTGTAYEMQDSSFINKTSYIENCETSAVGRALAMCGIGIDVSIASAEEVQNAINNQKDGFPDNAKMIDDCKKHYKGENLKKLLEYYKVNDFAELTDVQLKAAWGRFNDR